MSGSGSGKRSSKEGGSPRSIKQVQVKAATGRIADASAQADEESKPAERDIESGQHAKHTISELMHHARHDGKGTVRIAIAFGACANCCA